MFIENQSVMKFEKKYFILDIQNNHSKINMINFFSERFGVKWLYENKIWLQ